MKVVFNTIPLQTQSWYRGIGVYTHTLLAALQKYDPANEYLLATHTIDLQTADVIHYPYFDFFFLTLPLVKSKPTIVTVHDVIPLLYPKQYPRGVRGALKLAVQKYCLQKNADMVVTDSETSRRDVRSYLDIRPPKLRRVYLAANEDFYPAPEAEIKRVMRTYGLSHPYLLYVGDINYNKNVSGLLSAFGEIRSDHQLVLVSRPLRRDNPAAGSLWQVIDHLGIKKRLRVLTDVPLKPPATLRGLYGGADWYIQPSYYEGFGLPVLEAMKCGTAVISSDRGSLPEIAGKAAVPFNPLKEGSLVTVIHKALSLGKAERKRLIQKGLKQAHSFSWQQTAQEMVAIYEEIFKNKK